MQAHLKDLWIRTASVAAALAVVSLSPTAQAAVDSGSSSAYGLFVDTDISDKNNLLNATVSANLGPVPSVSGTAPAPYNNSASLASASVSAGSLLTLGQGTIDVTAGGTANALNVQASSNVDGSAGSRNADASASVANLSISENLVGVTSLLNTANLFGFTGSLITSEAHVSGDCGAFIASGDSVILDANGATDGFATFSVLGTNFNVAVDAQGRVAPNTTLTINASSATSFDDNLATDLTGSIKIILNEQIVSGDGSSSLAIEVNALHILFNSAGAEFLSLGGVVLDDTNLATGEIIVAHSEAFLACAVVPEPATAGMLAAGAGVLSLRRRRRI